MRIEKTRSWAQPTLPYERVGPGLDAVQLVADAAGNLLLAPSRSPASCTHASRQATARHVQAGNINAATSW